MMIKILKKTKSLLFLSKPLYISIFFSGILACTSVSKTSLYSEDLTFKIKWEQSSILTGKKVSFLSLVHIKGDLLLRIDLIQAWIGHLGSFFLNKNLMTLQVPMKKEYYQGEFDSSIFFPEFPSFPNSWLFSLLRGKAPKNWICNKQQGKLIYCKGEQIEVHWIYKNSQIYKIKLKTLNQQQIVAHIKSVSSRPLSLDFFSPKIKNYKQQKDLLFFQ